eukprot:1189936-Rhodomonas_salina.2
MGGWVGRSGVDEVWWILLVGRQVAIPTKLCRPPQVSASSRSKAPTSRIDSMSVMNGDTLAVTISALFRSQSGIALCLLAGWRMEGYSKLNGSGPSHSKEDQRGVTDT